MTPHDDAQVTTARRQAEDREKLELALSAARMGTFEWDLVKDTITISEQAARIFGGDPGTHEAHDGAMVFSILNAEDRPAIRDKVMAAIRAGSPYELEHRAVHQCTGREFWAFSAGTPLRGPSGRVERVIGVCQDISERKAAETQRETLVAELDHRVKNVLASVQSLALQSARKASSLDSFLKTFAGRLKSMASAHTLLTATRWRGAPLSFIAAAELGGLAPGQTHWEGPDLVLTPRATNAMALAFHELATNAVKFGALSTDRGRVDVHWRLTADGGFELTWQETGGPPVTPPTRQGFGTTLLNKVTCREINGETVMEYPVTGVRIVLTGDASVIVPNQPEAPAPAKRASVEAPTVAGASAGDMTRSMAAKIRGLKILIVEDSLLLSLELESGLTEAGAKVVGQAAEVEEALSMMEQDFDAAVLDCNLNGKSVAPVAEAMAAVGKPFIFATGYGDNQMAPQGFSAPVIRKPYDVTQVAAALAEATGRI
ncbi:MAG TPA: HWE histidine kinase domain-containing protein [Caulobacteraceae bacterium]|nr:HWE histidine kinase domain-containing protein [Caulobacteraceae bacterium]